MGTYGMSFEHINTYEVSKRRAEALIAVREVLKMSLSKMSLSTSSDSMSQDLLDRMVEDFVLPSFPKSSRDLIMCGIEQAAT